MISADRKLLPAIRRQFTPYSACYDSGSNDWERLRPTGIAEAVVEVCASSRSDTIELCFDNQDLMTRGCRF